MENIIFNTYKVASRLPLTKIAKYFNKTQDVAWKEYIKIEEQEIENILKYNSSNKAVYLYKYGCITFLNFNQNEIYIFLEYLKQIYVYLDSKLFSKFNESHMIISFDDYIILWEGSNTEIQYHKKLYDIVASILAKSIELYKIETELSDVLDEAGKFISYLNKGYLRANNKKVISIIVKCIRFKYRSIESVRLLGIPLEFNKTIELRKIFDMMSDYFELNERFLVLSNRMNVLDSITKGYFEFRNKKSERRLLMFEILLLCLFPLIHLISK